MTLLRYAMSVLILFYFDSCITSQGQYKIATRTMPYADYKMKRLAKDRIKTHLPLMLNGDTILSQISKQLFAFRWEKNNNVVLFDFKNSTCYTLIEIDSDWNVIKYREIVCEEY